MPPSKDLHAFKKVLSASKNIIVVAGAGLSAASGIPTFRGSGGMWRKYDAMSLATPESFAENPSLVWQFYHYRRESALKASPNAAHVALSSFTIPKVRERIAPGSDFTLITQNVDGLSPRSNEQVFAQAGVTVPDTPPYLIEMHGRLFDIKCTQCDHVEFDTSSPICEALAGTEALVEKKELDANIPIENLPRCRKCGSLARPGVVWFGEVPHDMPVIDKLVEKADLCLVIGTSSAVYPAAGYAAEVADNGGTVAVFNFERTPGDEDVDFLFLGGCEEWLPKALSLAEEVPVS
ncbi:NAD-dependent protein deacylase [Coprinopsis marcescibilis]|uniref:NAD-dependent protein deacylase n=1 Tax=Coprinopsis marcescibilis TaxID=230819 RepID=A0A5C3L3D4_COPMA|nr:NAD-dependent protein deacylase [Coprinopsis marcescibilis]